MKLFTIDGKFYKFLSTLWKLVKLNIIWIIFSLPIVTIGAATIAALKVTNEIVEDQDGYIWRDFFDAFKANIKTGIIIGLITLFLAYSVYLNIELFNKIEGNPLIFLILGLMIGLIAILHLIYAYPILARYDSTLRQAISNSREIYFKFFVSSIALTLIVGLLIIVFSFNFTLIFFGALLGPASIFLTISSFSMRNFRRIELEQEQE